MKRRNDELDKTMTGLGIVGTTTQPMTLEQRTSALAMVLQQQNVTQVEFLLTLDTRVACGRCRKASSPSRPIRKSRTRTIRNTARSARYTLSHTRTRNPWWPSGGTENRQDAGGRLQGPEVPAPYVWIISKNAVADNVKAIRDVAFDYLKTIGQVRGNPGAYGQRNPEAEGAGDPR